MAAAWAEVQSQYQRRADLVPNLVETVKGAAAHEKDTLEAVVAARARPTSVQLRADDLTPENLKKFEEAQGALKSALGRLLAVAESYPQINANENFRDLQVQLEYSEALDLFDRKMYLEAAEKMGGVVRKAPQSALARNAYKMMQDRAKQNAKKKTTDKVKGWLRGKIDG